MLKEEEFRAKYSIDDDTWAAAALHWRLLEEIYADSTARAAQLHLSGAYIADRLRQVDQVHSLKFRVKDPEHVIEKLVRKRASKPELTVTLESYREVLTDLVGVRALHLFKEDWPPIHDAIAETWELHETPVANVRKGDPDEMAELFAAKGCHINEHRFGYRSVHYVLRTKPAKDVVLAEVQVRTIFEEAWSEIDHQVRYPYDTENPLLSQFLVIFNRLAGSADEMGSFIRFLKRELSTREAREQQSAEAYDKVAAELAMQIEKLNITKKEKEQLEERVQQLTDKARQTQVRISEESLALLAKTFSQPVLAEPGAPSAKWRAIFDAADREHDKEVRAAAQRLAKRMKEVQAERSKPKK